jgi:hypothetical protein
MLKLVGNANLHITIQFIKVSDASVHYEWIEYSCRNSFFIAFHFFFSVISKLSKSPSFSIILVVMFSKDISVKVFHHCLCARGTARFLVFVVMFRWDRTKIIPICFGQNYGKTLALKDDRTYFPKYFDDWP